MRHLSLFSGIGGLDLAAEWAGMETVAFVEIEPFCQKVLAKHWPGVKIYDDVRTVGKEQLEKDGLLPVDIISGGFPCQPFSTAGQRKGEDDERHLWPQMLRVIREVRPRWVLGENVRGLLSIDSGRTFGRILSDLAEIGYRAGWVCYGAADVGAPHQRDRVFIVGHSEHDGQSAGADRGCDGEALAPRGLKRFTQGAAGEFEGAGIMADSELHLPHGGRTQPAGRAESTDGGADVADTKSNRLQRERATRREVTQARCEETELKGLRYGAGEQWATEPRLGGMVDGLSYWAHEPDGIPRVAAGTKNRVDRLRSLGNAVAPQQACPIFKAIMEIERGFE